MNEIYWITRFDSIHILCLTLMVVGIIISVITAIVYYAANGQRIFDEAYNYTSRAKENKGYTDTCKSILKYLLPITIISCLLTLFIPTTKEALLIYGVGGTIDYIKNNPTAKQIPDKCIIALDKWISSLEEEKSDSIKK